MRYRDPTLSKYINDKQTGYFEYTSDFRTFLQSLAAEGDCVAIKILTHYKNQPMRSLNAIHSKILSNFKEMRHHEFLKKVREWETTQAVVRRLQGNSRAMLNTLTFAQATKCAYAKAFAVQLDKQAFTISKAQHHGRRSTKKTD